MDNQVAIITRNGWDLIAIAIIMQNGWDLIAIAIITRNGRDLIVIAIIMRNGWDLIAIATLRTSYMRVCSRLFIAYCIIVGVVMVCNWYGVQMHHDQGSVIAINSWDLVTHGACTPN